MIPGVRLCVGHQHSPFWPILARFVDYYSLFWVPEGFSRFTNPRVSLGVGNQHSPVWPILARFVDYYSLFGGPRVISTIDEPRGAFTCRSSTLAVSADSGPFCGLLLSVLGSRSDFHD